MALAGVLVLEWSADARTASLALIGSVVALFVGNLYAEFVATDLKSGHNPTRAELRSIAIDSSAILVGAVPGLTLLGLAWAGWIEPARALAGAVWAGVVVLGGLGFVAGWLRGDSLPRCIGHGLALSLIGVVVLAIKSLH